MNIEEIELRDLRYFLACLEAGSLSAAAKQLHLAQPTLSHALNRLEQALGEPLLLRRGKGGLRCTPGGDRLMTCAQRVLGEVGTLAESFGEHDGPLQGSLRLGSIQSLNLTLLPKALARLVEEHPGIEPVMHTYEATEVAQAVHGHEIDLGLTAGAPLTSLSGLNVHELFTERFVAILRHDDALSGRKRLRLADLASRELVLAPPDSHTGRIIQEACVSLGLDLRVRMAVNSGETLRALVRAGLGPSILPAGYLDADDPGLVAIPLSDAPLQRQVVALHTRAYPLARTARALLAVLQDRP